VNERLKKLEPEIRKMKQGGASYTSINRYFGFNKGQSERLFRGSENQLDLKARIAACYRPRIEAVALKTKRSLNQVINLVMADAGANS
jgi:hypothetical protein